MRLTRPIIRALQLAMTTLLVLNFLFAELALEHGGRLAPAAWFEELTLERASLMRALFLNFDTFAADVGWVGLVVNYGAGKRAHIRFANLEHNATVVRDLDPRFFRVYEWFSAVYLNQDYPVRFEEAEVTTRFLERGFEMFPNDGALPFHAAMNYIGIQNPRGEGPQRRYERVIEFAQMAALRGDPDAAGVLPFYRARLRGDEKASRAAENDFLLLMFARAQTDAERNRLAEQIKKVAQDPEAAAKQLARFDAFATRHETEAPYLSRELFALVHP